MNVYDFIKQDIKILDSLAQNLHQCLEFHVDLYEQGNKHKENI